jgi:uncharacterized protein with HEPN domain
MRDILSSIERIMEYTKNMDFDAFRSDNKTVDAVLRNFMIIGEAAAHLPEEFVADHAEIPWQDMRDMRNAWRTNILGSTRK